jgi:stage II sporulation protein D
VFVSAILCGACVVQCAPAARDAVRSPAGKTRNGTVLLAQNETGNPDGDPWELFEGRGYYAEGTLFHVPSSSVRVMLRQNQSVAQLRASGTVTLHSGGTAGAVSFSGRAAVERGDAADRVFVSAGSLGRFGVALPCTLLSEDKSGIVNIGDTECRGSVIISAERGGTFSLLNYIDVEDYLRGVVPLEVGRGGPDVAEAVKAQAVAARTYTYRKMQDNAAAAYDVSATVADQVYGGVSAETDACSKAITDTRDEVMLFHDSLIYAYYHSTCGGKTANIEDAWSKAPLGYLRSVNDENGARGPFCTKSGAFTWEERWPLATFSNIVARFSRETFPQNPVSGELRGVSIDSRFACGRVKQCTVRTSKGTFVYGGDRIRFMFRRNLAGFPILKSAVITDLSLRDGTVVMKGRGYGHGVGMCQTGALARSRTGQKYDEILRAYYTGITIRKVAK